MKNRFNTILGTLAAIITAISSAFTASAQLQMGGWQTYFSYNKVQQIIPTSDKIYAVSNGNLFSVDKKYNSLEEYTKLTGLSDGNISVAAYNKERDVLVICYSSFIIDIIDHGKVYKMSDIANKDISGKTINSINFGGKYVYLSCGFGIVAIDLQKKEVANTYIIGPKGNYVSVLQTEITNDSIYALTPNALYSASRKDNNLANYEHWNARSLPIGNASTICLFEDKIHYFGDNWYIWDDGWKPTPYAYITNVNKVHSNKGFLTISSMNYVAIYNKELKRDTIFLKSITDTIRDAIYDPETDLIWLAQDTLKAIRRSTGEVENKFLPEGPKTNNPSFMKFTEGRVVSGYGPRYGDNGIVQQFDGNEWINFGKDDFKSGKSKFQAVYDITYDPKDTRRMFVSTWFSIFEFYDNEFVKAYNTSETNLVAWSGSEEVIAVENLTFDKEGNMWVLNVKGGNLMHCVDPDGKWHTLNCPSVFNISDISGFTICEKSKIKAVAAKQMNNSRETCLFLMQSGTKAYDVANQRIFKNFTITDGTTVSPSKIICVAEDKEGDLWVGTDIGPFVLKNISNVFNKDYKVTRIKITRRDDETLADYLLSTEMINTIAIDGANRKWIGTLSSGVYLLSPDGQETIHHFTTSNSPLTTNSITSIDINPENGIVYIQTPNGLFSYKSDAAQGKSSLSDVHVYPNPVRPDYSGVITITGLMENTEVRITDAAGRVVCHGKSNGSVYTWDGCLSTGRRASTGVYYVFQATKDGGESNVSKFAIIKK
ncbi:MAG: hypothetical protein IKP37_14795 [Paludibacteraceae bacterium]|nr:hypothetical protein [Paludibacteraceae bacterium]